LKDVLLLPEKPPITTGVHLKFADDTAKVNYLKKKGLSEWVAMDYTAGRIK
jgi:hypothetical protein